MNDSETSIPYRRLKSSLAEPLAVSAVIIVLVISGLIAVRNFTQLRETRLMVRHTNRVLASLQVIESSLSEAESSQRGYVITGDKTHLGRFTTAINLTLEENAALNLDARSRRAARSVRKPLARSSLTTCDIGLTTESVTNWSR